MLRCITCKHIYTFCPFGNHICNKWLKRLSQNRKKILEEEKKAIKKISIDTKAKALLLGKTICCKDCSKFKNCCYLKISNIVCEKWSI